MSRVRYVKSARDLARDGVGGEPRKAKFSGEALRSQVRSIRCVYETDADIVARIPGWVEEIVEAQPMTRFDRCHFKTLGQWALEFETVYYMTVPDYKVFMGVQQSVNLALMRKLAAAGVEFAYPTQLQYSRQLDPRPTQSNAGRGVTRNG